MARTKSFDTSEVLDKALYLFWEKGYNATSIQDLVDHLGINRASIYDTWGDKHALYLASLQRYRKHISEDLISKLRSDKSARAIIESFLFETIEAAMQDMRNKGCFLSNSASELANCDHTVHAIFTDNRKKIEGVLNELIKEGQSAGEFSSKHSSESMARFIFTTVSGLRIIAKGEISEKELTEVVNVALSALD